MSLVREIPEVTIKYFNEARLSYTFTLTSGGSPLPVDNYASIKLEVFQDSKDSTPDYTFTAVDGVGNNDFDGGVVQVTIETGALVFDGYYILKGYIDSTSFFPLVAGKISKQPTASRR